MIDQTVKESVEEVHLPSCLLCLFSAGRGMLVGSLWLSVFYFVLFFPFLPCDISCVFTVFCPYTSGILLFMCNYWSYIIGWVCLTMAKVLCPPSDLYMPVHSMCSNHCIAFDVSSVTVTETGFLADTDLDENLHLATTLKISCRISRREKKNNKKIWENSGEASVLFEVFRNSGCVLAWLWTFFLGLSRLDGHGVCIYWDFW